MCTCFSSAWHVRSGGGWCKTCLCVRPTSFKIVHRTCSFVWGPSTHWLRSAHEIMCVYWDKPSTHDLYARHANICCSVNDDNFDTSTIPTCTLLTLLQCNSNNAAEIKNRNTAWHYYCRFLYCSGYDWPCDESHGRMHNGKFIRNTCEQWMVLHSCNAPWNCYMYSGDFLPGICDRSNTHENEGVDGGCVVYIQVYRKLFWHRFSLCLSLPIQCFSKLWFLSLFGKGTDAIVGISHLFETVNMVLTVAKIDCCECSCHSREPLGEVHGSKRRVWETVGHR